MVGRRPQKLALLSGRGITTGTAEDVEAGAFDVAVECKGNAEGFALAHRNLRPRGDLGAQKHLCRQISARCFGYGR